MATAAFLKALARQTRGKFYASEFYQVYGCAGATPIQVLANALAATGIPATGAALAVTIGAIVKSLGVSERIPTPDDGSNDSAEVEIKYTEDDFIVPGYGPTIKEFATDLEQIETAYDYTNRQTWFSNPAAATAIAVSYTFGTAVETRQVTVPALLPRGTRVYTREDGTDPATYADNYIGMTNSATFGVSAAVGTLLCVSIRGVNVGDGRWRTTFAFAKRREGWKALATYPFEHGFTPSDVTEGNGRSTVTVQGTADFNNLGLL